MTIANDNRTATMRVVIVDDEPLARARLRELLGEQAGIAVVAEAADGHAALHACAERVVVAICPRPAAKVRARSMAAASRSGRTGLTR